MQEEQFITIRYHKGGHVVTEPAAYARRQIAFGAAVETVPENEEQRLQWFEAQHQKVRQALRDKYDGAMGRRPDILHEHLDALRDFETWGAENDICILPATECVAVRYLLSRVASGKLERQHVSRRAFLIGALHDLTRHPPRGLGAAALNGFNRAIAFAIRQQKNQKVPLNDQSAAAPAVALKMFPEGNVPRHFHEIAS